jgi:triacylglycerol lipase
VSLFVAILVILLFVPLLCTVLAVVENIRSGDLSRVRQLCHGRLATALARSFLNSVWSLWLTVLVLPLGFLRRPGVQGQAGGAVPVLLVHGLYHAPVVWFVFRRRLAAVGLRSIWTFGYSSFRTGFEAIVTELCLAVVQASASSSTGQVLLVGHSLGGLLIRAASAKPELHGKIAGIVSLGAPHRGSTLAGMLALGRLGQGLKPGGKILRHLDGLEECRAPALSLFTPTDVMVLPLRGALLTPRQHSAGWAEECLGPVSHVGLLYDGYAASRAAEYLMACTAGSEADGREAQRKASSDVRG